MSLCTAKLLSQLNAAIINNGITLDAILEALLTQNDKLNDQAVNLGEGCFNTGGAEPVILTRIITIVDGAVTATMYLNADDTPYVGVTPVPADPCDCPCLECGETIVKACLFVDLFDSDSGLLAAGETSQFDISTNAGSQTIVHDYTTSATGTGKASWYTPIMALINGIADWSIVLEQDTDVSDNSKPTYRIIHTGSAPDTLKIVKSPNNDIYTISSDGVGGITGVSDDGGSGIPFGSDPFDHPACKDGVAFPVDQSGAFKTTGHQPDMISVTAYEYQGNNSGNPSASMNGLTYAAYKADLVSAGYVIVTSATAGNGETVVADPLGLGLPSAAKVETPSDTVLVDWTTV